MAVDQVLQDVCASSLLPTLKPLENFLMQNFQPNRFIWQDVFSSNDKINVAAFGSKSPLASEPSNTYR
jgi:hypothetical protein